MDHSPTAYRRPLAGLFLIVSYLLWAAVGVRWITEFMEAGHPFTWLVSLLLAFYGLLLGLEPRLTRAFAWRVQLYLALQTALVMTSILFYYELDFFAILLLPVCGQAVFLLERRTALGWVVIFLLANLAGQVHQFGWPGALSFILLYSAGLVFVAAFALLTLQAEASRQRAEALLAELQDAHEQLRASARQAEELAVVKERNRLAHDLHDAVAQTLYGLTLQAEAAARQLSAGALELVGEYLGEMRASAQQALAETRLLIFELRPPLLEQAGLAAALRARLEVVEARSGLQIRLELAEVRGLNPAVEDSLYRIALEALNNTLKHAQAHQVSVELAEQDGKIVLEVNDDGVGFTPPGSAPPGSAPLGSAPLGSVPPGPVSALPGVDLLASRGFGLAGMQARAAQVGGRLTIESAPGHGTRLRVEVPR